jgi:hypothetical protein
MAGSRPLVEGALDYLADVGHLVRTGHETLRITVEDINEVQRWPQL